MSRHLVVAGKDIFSLHKLGQNSSGNVSTTQVNGHGRALVKAQSFHAAHAGDISSEQLHRIFATSLNLGDDNVSPYADSADVVKCACELGALVSEVKESDRDSVDFTSHLYNLDAAHAIFNNGEKMKARLLFTSQQRLAANQIAGILFAARHNVELTKQIKAFVHEQDVLKGTSLLEDALVDLTAGNTSFESIL
jgi:hypothetical protein